MSSASKVSLWKKGLGVFAAAALASAVMVAPAFATSAPSVQGYTTNTGTGSSVDGDTQMYIQQAPAGAISVTAPTKLYFYLTSEATNVSGVDWGNFITPTNATLTNNGTNAVHVSGWKITNTAGQFTDGGNTFNYANPHTEAAYQTTSTSVLAAATTLNASDTLGDYYLQARPLGYTTSWYELADPTAVSISGTDETVWTMTAAGSGNDAITLELQGEMKGFDTGTTGNYERTWFTTGDRALQTVTWTFAS